MNILLSASHVKMLQCATPFDIHMYLLPPTTILYVQKQCSDYAIITGFPRKNDFFNTKSWHTNISKGQ